MFDVFLAAVVLGAATRRGEVTRLGVRVEQDEAEGSTVARWFTATLSVSGAPLCTEGDMGVFRWGVGVDSGTTGRAIRFRGDGINGVRDTPERSSGWMGGVSVSDTKPAGRSGALWLTGRAPSTSMASRSVQRTCNNETPWRCCVVAPGATKVVT